MVDVRNVGLELHDSKLHSVTQVGQHLHIALRPTYIYHASERSVDDLICMSQDAVFEFDDGHLEGDLGDLPDAILDGSLILGSRRIDGLIPVPFHAVGLSSLKLFLRPDYREIAIVGRGLRIRLEGEPVPHSHGGIEERG